MSLPSTLMPAGMLSLETLCRLLSEQTGQSQTLAGGATVHSASYSAFREVSLVAGGAGNTDTLIHTIPAGTPLSLDEVRVRVTQLPVAGAGFTAMNLSLGISSGGAELITAQNFLAAGLPAVNTKLGLLVAQLGASLPSTQNYKLVHDGATPLNIFLRSNLVGGGLTAGSVRVSLHWRPEA